MRKLRPLTDHLILELIEESERTACGLYIPEMAKEKPQRGLVIAVGPGKRASNDLKQRIPIDINVGDEVLFSKYGGDGIKMDGKEYKILRETDILAVIQR